MTRRLYAALMWLLQPVLRRRMRLRAQAEPEYGVAVAERFGHYAQPLVPQAGPLVWVHAVSLGETLAAASLIAQLRQCLPGMRLLLTHGTATGRAQGRSLLQAGDLQTWLPWDARAPVARFLQHFSPAIGLLMETEVWPNLVAACQQRQLPLCLVNARLNAKSLRRAQQLGWLSGPAFGGLRAVWAQSEADAQRLRLLGAPVLGVHGNFKFDANPDAAQLQQGRALRQRLGRPVLMLANAREGEEQQLLDLLARARPLDAVQWLIVPRHPQRFDAVAGLIRSSGFSLSRRSQWGDATQVPPPADIWLGDSLGEMALYYGMADVALLGGSFASLGGHNLIEAAACACPILLGPHTFNFAEAASLALQTGAALRCTDMAAAVDQANRLVQDSTQLQQLRAATQRFCAPHRGAAQRTARAVCDLLLGEHAVDGQQIVG